MMEHRLLLQNETPTPLGRLKLSGWITNGIGVVPRRPMRVYGSYALVCLIRGNGQFEDVNGVRQAVSTNDCWLVFPELAHCYGPDAGQRWDEFYVTFDGPIFDLWRQTGILTPHRPICSVPSADFLERLREVIERFALEPTPTKRLTLLCHFCTLLAELLSPTYSVGATTPRRDWLAEVKTALESELRQELDLHILALRVGVSYETLRKRFQQVFGVAPARYRTQRRIAAACELLRYSPQLTNRQVAETLGFADEYHFSRRFTQVMGTTPRAFRQAKHDPEKKPEEMLASHWSDGEY